MGHIDVGKLSAVFISAGFVCTGLALFFQSRRILRTYARAVGIVSIVEKRAGPFAVPIAMIDWVDPKGFKYQLPVKDGVSGVAGTKITVLFDPTNPARVRVESFQSLWMFPALFGGLGLIALIAFGLS